MNCFSCPRHAKWEIKQAGAKQSLASCHLHSERALTRVLTNVHPPRPIAQVFALVTPMEADAI